MFKKKENYYIRCDRKGHAARAHPIEHGAQDLSGHDQARCLGPDLHVARQQADVAEHVAEIAKLGLLVLYYPLLKQEKEHV